MWRRSLRTPNGARRPRLCLLDTYLQVGGRYYGAVRATVAAILVKSPFSHSALLRFMSRVLIA